MSTDKPVDLCADYKAAFVYSYSTHRWQSRRGFSRWTELEGWQDNIAGPVNAIVETGGCAYVYARNDGYLHDVDDPDGLHAALRRNHQALRLGIDAFRPRSREEEFDVASMHRFATAIWVLAERAIEIEKNRWANERVASH